MKDLSDEILNELARGITKRGTGMKYRNWDDYKKRNPNNPTFHVLVEGAVSLAIRKTKIEMSKQVKR